MNLPKFFTEYNALKNIPRTGWLHSGVPGYAVKSIALHLLDTAIISMFITGMFRENGYKVDGEKVLKLALIHDLPEVRTGDTALPYKKYFGREIIKKGEREAFIDIIKIHNIPGNYLETYDAKSENSDIEGRIVSISDIISMLMECINLKRQGIKTVELEQLYENCKDDFINLTKNYKFLSYILDDVEDYMKI